MDNFSSEIVLSKNPYILTDDIALQLSKIFNEFLFDSKISIFPEIKVLSYKQICQTIKQHEVLYGSTQEKDVMIPKNIFFGLHHVMIENNIETLKLTDKLEYSHEIIMMNIDKLKYCSFILNAASLCHELIHYYDEHFGDGELLDKWCILNNLNSNDYAHSTKTFVTKQKLAIQNKLNVISIMDKPDKILDKESLELMIQALTPEELKLLEDEYKKQYKNKKISIMHID